MPRLVVRPRSSAVVVRQATLEDLPGLVALADDLPAAGIFFRSPRSRSHANVRTALSQVREAAAEPVTVRIERALTTPGNHLLVGLVDEELAGMVWCRIGPLGHLGSGQVVHIEQFHVRGSKRRRGVGRSLLQGVVRLAESYGADAVTTWTGPQDREVNRYFARVGFVPLAIRRLAPVSSLRRSLATSGELDAPFPRATETLRRERRRTD